MMNSNNNTRRVAIVGAGFAGLTLANFLEKRRASTGDVKSEVDYQIFESKSAPIQICGPIFLPHGRSVLSKLGLNLENRKDKSPGKHKEEDILVVEQEVFLSLLRSKVQHKISYSSEIVTVERRSDNQFYLLLANGKTPLGPFDIVVAADGLFGLTASCPNQITLVIGDARWQHHMWFWDFGRRRRQKGADIAICDAMELGESLVAENENSIAKYQPSSTPKLLLLLKGQLGLFLIPLIISFVIQLLSESHQEAPSR